MGGCLSKKSLPTHGKKNKSRPSKKKDPAAVERGAPPPSPPEEEAVVKEVLTETPTSSIVAAPCNSRRAAEDTKAVEPPHKVDAATPPTSVNGFRYGLDGRSEEEDASEMCSASENFSVSTTLTEKRDVEAEDLEEETSALRKGPSKRRPPERSPEAWKSYHQRTRSSSSGEFHSRRDLKCGIGGVGGRSSPSPVKRSSFPGRNAARQRAGNGNAAAAGSARTDRGERCGRGRSASPAAKRVATGGGGGRGGGVNRSSPLRRKAGPGRASPERTPRREEDDCSQMMMKRGGGGADKVEEGEGGMPPAPVSEETLENPLVSLECFIFL